LGVAAFHPPGALLAHRFSQGRPGHSMAVYVTSGTMGFALGPLAVASVAQRFGLTATAWLVLPLVALGVYALGGTKEPPPLTSSRPRGFGFAALRPHAKPLALLYFVVVIRGFVSAVVTTFLPVLLARRGASVTMAAAAVTVYFLGGGVGGFFGGTMADTLGHRRVILVSMLGAAPFLVVSPMVSPGMALVCLTIAGFFLQSTLSVNVSFGQLLAPGSAATVASLLMGFAWGLGGLLIPVAGVVADHVGLVPTMAGLGLVPLVGAALAWPLPKKIGA
jgi:FSR family fosmidomycin resistance protein-like MFS transporter